MTTSNSTASPSPTLLTAFLGLLREMAVCYSKIHMYGHKTKMGNYSISRIEIFHQLEIMTYLVDKDVLLSVITVKNEQNKEAEKGLSF